MFRGRKGKANWAFWCVEIFFKFQWKELGFCFLDTSSFTEISREDSQHMLPLPPPKKSPHVTFHSTFHSNPEPGFHLSMAGGSNRHLRRPQQVLLASQQATPEWRKTRGRQDAERNSESSTPLGHPTSWPNSALSGSPTRNISAWRRNKKNPSPHQRAQQDSPHFNEPFQQLPASKAMPVVSLLYAANARSVWIDESHVGPFLSHPVTWWPNGGHCCEVEQTSMPTQITTSSSKLA